MSNFVSHLESAIDDTRFPLRNDYPYGMHNDRPLWVRYDLDSVRNAISKGQLSRRPATLWRYRELLPVGDQIEPVSFGEGMTPLLPCSRLGKDLGLNHLWIKDESQLPTGSFKSRGMAMAITMAKWLGITRVALPSAGNAGGAAAAYAARAGIEAFVFMPEDTPAVNQYEARLTGARTYLVNGLINDCGRIVADGKQRLGWFDLSTLKEPYRIEGKKTMGLELAEQFQWQLPDVILYPTGGGTGLIGMWKAFNELKQMGWLARENLPRMVGVQSEGCCPVVRAFESGERFAEPFVNAQTMASGIRVPTAVGDFMILDAIRESQGTAVAVPEESISDWMRRAAQAEGTAICPEAAACVAAAETLVRRHWIAPDENVVIFNTGAAQKYVEAIGASLPRIDLSQPIDWESIERTES